MYNSYLSVCFFIKKVALHELFHSLGFSKDLFKKFKDCSQTSMVLHYNCCCFDMLLCNLNFTDFVLIKCIMILSVNKKALPCYEMVMWLLYTNVRLALRLMIKK